MIASSGTTRPARLARDNHSASQRGRDLAAVHVNTDILETAAGAIATPRADDGDVATRRGGDAGTTDKIYAIVVGTS